MLRAFSAKRYRNIDTDDLKFERINVLLGPNNSGKSTLIDAIGFFASLLFSSSPQSAFIDALNERGRGDLLDRAAKTPGEIEMKWVLSSPGAADLTYELNFKMGRSEDFPSAFYITKEQLRYNEPSKGKDVPFRFIDCHTKSPGKGEFSVRDAAKGHIKPHPMEVDARDSVFRQLKTLLKDKSFYNEIYPQFERTADFVRSYFEGFHAYSSTEFNPKKVAEGVPTDLTVRSLDRTGAQLVNVLRHIDQRHDLDEYTERLRELIPDLRRVKIVDVSDTRKQVELEMKDKQKFKLREMSDGTLKAMLLALLCSTPERMKLLTIDEPEQNMHPAWLKVIGRWLQTARSTDQIIVSTHSPDLLDQFTEAFREGKVALFVCGWQGKGIHRMRAEELDPFFEEGWELGDLYRVGEPKLGGWPW